MRPARVSRCVAPGPRVASPRPTRGRFRKRAETCDRSRGRLLRGRPQERDPERVPRSRRHRGRRGRPSCGPGPCRDRRRERTKVRIQEKDEDGAGGRRGSDAELGADTDEVLVEGGPIDRGRVRRERLNTERESERSGERGSLVSYFRDIASIPTLSKQQEVLLAKEI